MNSKETTHCEGKTKSLGKVLSLIIQHGLKTPPTGSHLIIVLYPQISSCHISMAECQGLQLLILESLL